jgi:hypothetical protein
MEEEEHFDFEAVGRLIKAVNLCHALRAERLTYLDITAEDWTPADWYGLAARHNINRPSMKTERLVKGLMKGAYRRGIR